MENENKEQSLVDYVMEKIKMGLGHDEIKKQLNAVGWNEEEVDSAYALGLINSGVPVPSRNSQQVFLKKTSTVEIVINFFSFILLGILATSWGVLLYGIINHFFVDKLNSYSYYNSSADTIHYATAAIIISFPLYFWAMRFWFSCFAKDDGKVESKLTRWITYLVLLAAAITIVGDLIVIIFNMLQGELTIRFFLKALTILIIAGGVFGFYFLERKKIQYKKVISTGVFIIFGWVTLSLLVVSIILGFLASGSPKTERMRTFDRTRANDLQSIASCINSYAYENRSLPKSLDDLGNNSSFSYCSGKNDPETGMAYEYKILNNVLESGGVSKGEFELCANFSLVSEVEISGYNSYYEGENKWSKHKAGRDCDKEVVVLKKEIVN